MSDALTSPGVGAAYALGSAFMWALTSLLVRRLGATSSMMTINAVRVSASGLLLLVLSFAGTARAEIMAMSMTTFVLIASSTVIAAGIGDSIFFECVRILGLGRAMTLASSYPLLAAGFASVVLGESITLRAAGQGVVAPLVVLSALTAVSSLMWVAGLKYSNVMVATVLSSTSPMFALILGALFLDERLTPFAIVGAMLTVVGIVVLKV